MTSKVMVKALWRKLVAHQLQLQILLSAARKCERDDLGPKQMIPGDEEQKQEWEANCEHVRQFLRSSLSLVDEETLKTMLADVGGLKSTCRTLHFMQGGDDLEPPHHAAETVAVANARRGHGRSRSRTRAPTPSRLDHADPSTKESSK